MTRLKDVLESQRGRALELTRRLAESDYSMEDIEQIVADYDSKFESFKAEAVEIATILQSFTKVHAVSSRVKGLERLIDKIFRRRKKWPEAEKITKTNYGVELKDIIGVRALYLYPSDCFEINQQIKNMFGKDYCEKPEIRLREGDNTKPFERLCKSGSFQITSDQDYRSIHYGLKSTYQEDLLIEIQIRTVFEEGWSAINHRLYENTTEESDTLSKVISSILSHNVGVCNDIAELLLKIETESPQAFRGSKQTSLNESDEFEKVLRDFLRGKLI
jgi:ppGpp synthetase/RelA/SpoT-type nucleotidyltranferase